MDRDARLVRRKIRQYKPKGGLEHTANLVLTMYAVNEPQVKGHAERVALLAEAVAKQQKKDAKAAFFGGLLHDFGKLLLPADLFTGREITPDEYLVIKQHALKGFSVLRRHHQFVALCAGLHHNLYQRGYGIGIDDFPQNWSLATVKKVFEISMIISICDYLEAATHRKTKVLDGSTGPSLKQALLAKYPDEQLIVLLALDIAKKNFGW